MVSGKSEWQVASISFVTKAVDGSRQDAVDFFCQRYALPSRNFVKKEANRTRAESDRFPSERVPVARVERPLARRGQRDGPHNQTAWGQNTQPMSNVLENPGGYRSDKRFATKAA